MKQINVAILQKCNHGRARGAELVPRSTEVENHVSINLIHSKTIRIFVVREPSMVESRHRRDHILDGRSIRQPSARRQ